MINVVDARRCQSLQNSFDDITICVEESKSENVMLALRAFHSTALSAIVQALKDGDDLEKIKVPVVLGALCFKEREEFEDIVNRVGGWIPICGDRWLLILSPERCVEDPIETQLTYLSNTGRYCSTCSVFTEHIDVDERWSCPSCGRWVGCYESSDFAMGRVATSIERHERIEVHKVIDSIWKEGLLKRRDLYKEIAEVLNIPRPYSHVAMLTPSQLAIVKVWARARYAQLSRAKNN